MKQYVMICEESNMNLLRTIFRDGLFQFLEVQGMSMGEEGKFNVLVTPIPVVKEPKESL